MTVLALDFGLHDYMRKALEVSDISVAEAAARLGVAPDTVSKWINGRNAPRKTALMAFAMVTGVDYSIFEECARRDSNPQPSDLYSAGDLCPCEFDHEDPKARCYCSCHGDPNADALDVELQLLLLVEGVHA